MQCVVALDVNEDQSSFTIGGAVIPSSFPCVKFCRIFCEYNNENVDVATSGIKVRNLIVTIVIHILYLFFVCVKFVIIFLS